MSEWYCRLFGQELGPMSRHELIFLVEKGNLRRDTLVCQGAERVWLPAGEVRGLFDGERREQSARVEPSIRERPRFAEARALEAKVAEPRGARVARAPAKQSRGRKVSEVWTAKRPQGETASPRRAVRVASVSFPSLPWFKAFAILLTVVGIASAGRVAYRAAGERRANHLATAQELERYFGEVQQSQQTSLDQVAVAMLQGRLRAQISALRIPLQNSTVGTLEATLDAAAESVLTMAECLTVTKSPAAEQAFSQKADEFQRLLAHAKQSTSGA